MFYQRQFERPQKGHEGRVSFRADCELRKLTNHERIEGMKKKSMSTNVHKSNVAAMLTILLFTLCIMHLQVKAQWGSDSRRYRLGSAAESGNWTNSDGKWGYCLASDSRLKITSYQGNAKIVTTPQTINGMHVTSIGRRTFAGSSVEEVIISEGVWEIERYAFRGCQSLRRVTLPKSLMQSCVESSPFKYCRNLESLIIPLSLKDSFNIPRQAKVFYYENEPAEVSVLSDTDDTVETEAVFNTNPEKAEEARPYQVKFDPNRDSVARRYGSEGVGFMSLISFKTGDVVKLPANKFTCSVREMRAGDFYTETYSFGGWATNKTGDVVFADEAEVQLDGDTTLYAKWILDHYLRFDANGGTGNMHAIRLKKGASVKLPKNGFECSVRPGYRYRKRDEEVCIMFSGWAADKGGKTVYAEGSEVSFDADKDVTLYAKWIDACEVHFMPNTSGIDEQMPNMKMPANVSFDLHTNSYVREGYEFQGWALEPEGEVKFEDGENVSFGHGIVKLYAKWSDMQNYHVVLHANNYEKIEILVPKGTEKTLPTDRFVCSPRELGGKFAKSSMFELAGWAKGPEGEVCYTNGAAIKPNDDMDLYAVWQLCADIDVQEGTLRKANLNGLKSFELPANVTNISCRWSGAMNMTEFRVHPDNPVYSAKDGFLLNKSGEKVLVLMIPSKNIAIPKGVKEIGKRFIDNSLYMYGERLYMYGERPPLKQRYEITSVSIPDGVVSVNDDAFSIDYHHEFSKCYHLTKVNLPDTLKNIGHSAFKGCAELAEIKIPVGTTNIGDHAFSGCKMLVKIDIPASIASIGKYAFEECDALSELSISNRMIKIGEYAFYKCTSITNVAIPFQTMTNYVERGLFHRNDDMAMSVDMGDGKILNLSPKMIREHGVGKDLCDYIEFQTRRNDVAYKFPSDSFCNAHPALYKDFCAGASKVWCEQRKAEIRENGERCDARFKYDDKLKILASVTIAFESPGVSVEALEAKYRKSAKGKFWKKQTTKGTVGDSKIAYEAKKFRRNASLEDSRGGAKVDLISMGDDEIEVFGEVYEAWGLMSLAVSQDVQTGKAASQGRLGSITIRSRKLDAALAERDRKENEAKAKADAAAAAKKEAEALNF